MSVAGCYRILVKVLQYILSRHNYKEVVSGCENCPEIGVTFIADNEDLCTNVQASYCGPHEFLFDVRCLVKTIGEELNAVKELQLKVAGTCLSACQVFEHMRKLYSLYYNSNVGWELRTNEQQLLPENNEVKTYISFAVNVNLPISVAKNLHDSLFGFLKKCQLTMPYLTVVSKINGRSCKRPGIYGLSKEENWCKNISLYLRTFGQTDFRTANGVKYKYVKMKRSASCQCPSFSIMYGSTQGADIGKENHLHVMLFSENGIPLFLDNRIWHDAVSLPATTDNKVTLQAGTCTQGLVDVCYFVTSNGPKSCYFILLLTKDEDYLKRLIKEHNGEVVSTIVKTAQEMVAAEIAHQKDKKWSRMMAKSLGSIIRFSQNNEFRRECLQHLQATDSMDAEVKLEHRFLNFLQDEH